VLEPASTPVSERRPYHGHEGVHAYFADLDQTWEEFEIDITEIREGPSALVGLCRIYARAGGFVADSPAAILVRLRGERVVGVKTYVDRAEALRAAGLQ
jgi:ketosteroid isomerase-like protein